MALNFHIMNSGGELSSLLGAISQAIKKIQSKVEPELPLPEVDVVIAASPEQTIPEIGVGGHAYTKHLIEIYINPEFENIDKTLEAAMLGTAAHEAHHVARINTVGYGKTLLEACVSEGLASHFEMECASTPPRPWDKALSDEELENLRKIAQNQYNSNYNHSDWFFGNEDKNFPRWGGYSLGFDIVNKYMSKTGKKASELYNVPAEEFI
ncbi:DUF2268 domain-containing protein [Candidatus Parcubacteria bacterium]|nr:DUF2268 domain-containing protein [Candidatus Parcubacteria bacterium]